MSGRPGRLPLLLAGLVVGLVLAAAAGLFFYARATRLLDAHLDRAVGGNSLVYSQPYTLRRGQILEWGSLRRTLNRLGYSPQLEQREGMVFLLLQPGSRPFLRLSPQGENRYRLEAIGEARPGEDEVRLAPLPLSNLYGNQRRKQIKVSFRELPEMLVKAVLAAEDARFFTHPGIDVLSLLRAAAVNLVSWEPRQGGSTLTQQFVKNHFLTPEKTLFRKVQELFLAYLLERRLSKEEIFELYANQVYLGQVGSFAVTGFGQGALSYFGKDVGQLSLGECALLAGIIQAPNRYSPFRDLKGALRRRDYVLERMEEAGFITIRQNAEARLEEIRLVSPAEHDVSQAPYFVDYVRSELERMGVRPAAGRELRIWTTLDPILQEAAVRSVRRNLEALDGRLRGRPQAALVALDPATGAILAMVGGREYSASQFNRAVHARRQPGSTFKPFVYALALESGLTPHSGPPLTPASFLTDEPFTWAYEDQVYQPRNFNERYRGQVSLREALSLSLNVPAVRLAQLVGLEQLLEVTQRLFPGKKFAPYPSLALGSFEVSLLELARAYAALANGGRLPSLKAVFAYGREGERSQPAVEAEASIFHPTTAFLVTSMLESALETGTARAVRSRGFSLPAAGKTGTADDSWFVGYTPDLLAAVWVGFDQASPLGLTGSQAALPIWTDFMLEAQRAGRLSGRPFAVPEHVVVRSIDPQTGFLATSNCPTVREEYFVVGTEPWEICPENGRRYQVQVDPPREGKRGFWGWIRSLLPH